MTITQFAIMGALQRAEAKAQARMGTPGARFEVFVWNHPKGTRRFSIDFAMEPISSIGIEPKPIVTPENAREALRLNDWAGELVPEHVDAADLSKPILIMQEETPEGPRCIIIDGWHRITKAVKLNHNENLYAYVIPEALAQLCEVE